MFTRVMLRLVTLSVLIGCLFILAPALAEDGPNFRILQPTGEQSLADQFPIAIAFQSPDDTPIVRFDAYLDSTFILGGRVKNPIPAGSFQVPCDLATVTITPGAHKLYVKLTDANGRTTQQVQAVTVGASKVEHVAPTVRIVAPKEGAGISGPSTIRIEASDESGVKWVMLYINGQLRMMMNEAPFVAPWDPIKDKLAAGTYTLRVRAIDNFDNEAVSDPVVVRVVRPSGQTPIETKVPASTFTTLGVFEVSSLYQPSGGPDIPRLAFSNVIAPISEWFAGRSLPSPNMFTAERRYAMPAADGSPLALLPPKALPGQTLSVGLESRALPLAPMLAWASYRMPHPVAGSQPVAMPSLLMPFEQSSRRADVETGPVPFTALLPEKGLPPISEQSLYVVPETPSAQSASPAMANAALPALPSVDRQAPVLVALVPGTMMKIAPSRATDVTALPAQPRSTERALPQKSTPALPTGEVPLPGVKAVSPITPSHGMTLSRPAADAVRQANVTGAPKLPSVVQAARPDLSSPTPAAPLPTKATPVLMASAEVTAAPHTATAYTPNPTTRAIRPSMDASLLPSQPHLPAAVMEVHEPYTVQTDDSLEKIARAFSTTPDELIKLNPTLSPERPLPVNSTLVVPKTEARIYVDETPLLGAATPFISNGYTMVPMRNIIEAKDGIVIWLPKTQEVNAWADNTFMGVKIGDRQARINAESYLLPVAPSLQQERTMVPLRYLMSALDLHMEYNAASGTYYLVSR